MKICTKCGELKTLSEYSHKRAKGRPPGLQPRCKVCAAQDTREWNIKNKASARNRYLLYKYGITEVQYLEMLAKQQNCCAICGTQFSDVWGADAPVVDHCHATGNVRGLLCNECNRGLGYFHDNPEALTNAASYIKKGGCSCHI